MKLIVEQCQRYAKMRAHTATHLLHTELAKIFKTTKQAGSLVDEDYLRFDFNADRLLTPEEIHDIEKNINQMIYDAYDVEVKERSYDEAITLGAKAFFEDKYGDTVRVVRVFTHDNEIISIELCGGTHVANTKDIGCFAITGQEAVASGVKRISAVVGPKVGMRLHEIQDILDTILEKLDIKTITQLKDKLEKVIKKSEEMKDQIENYENDIISKNIGFDKKIIDQVIQKTKDNVKKEFYKWLDAAIILDPKNQTLKEIDFKKIFLNAVDHYQKNNVLIFREDGSFGVYFGKKDHSAKDFLEKFGLKGGGSDQMVQGKDPKVLTLF